MDGIIGDGSHVTLWAYVKFPFPNRVQRAIPAASICYVVSPKDAKGIRKKTLFDPKNELDFSLNLLYSVKTGDRSSDGKEHPYYCQIGRMKVGTEQDLLNAVEKEPRIKWPPLDPSLSEPDSSDPENHVPNLRDGPTGVFGQREASKMSAMHKRHVSNNELEKLLASNRLLKTGREAETHAAFHSTPASVSSQQPHFSPMSPYSNQVALGTASQRYLPEQQRNQVTVLPASEHSFQGTVDPWEQIEHLKRELEIKSSELEVLKNNSVAQITTDTNLLQTFSTLFKDEIEKINTSLQEKVEKELKENFERLKQELSDGATVKNCKFTRRGRKYVQAWVNTVRADFIPESI